MKTIDFYFFRHAESLANTRPEVISGRSNDSPLTNWGKMQALALRFANYNFDEVYSSEAIRAQSTAQIAYPEFPITLSPKLVEIDQGAWTGRKRNEIYMPRVLDEIAKDPWNFRPQNGETQAEVGNRMYSFVVEDVLSKKDLPRRLAVFTHGVAIKCLLRKILDFDPQITWRFHIDNTGLTQLRYTDMGWWPIKINDTSHLTHMERVDEFIQRSETGTGFRL